MVPKPRGLAKVIATIWGKPEQRTLAPKGALRRKAMSNKAAASPQHRPYFTDPSYHFFKLPIELRNKVYRNLADDEDSNGQLIIMADGKIEPENLSGNLLSTCKVIYEEYTAAIFCTRSTLSASNFAHFASVLSSICGTGQACIKELLVLRDDELHGITLSFGRELRALGQAPVPILWRLPHLPALKTVTFRYTSELWLPIVRNPDAPVPCKALLARLMKAKAVRYHFLRQYMRAIGKRDDVAWRMEFVAEHEGNVNVLTNGRVVLAPDEKLKICTKVKVVAVQKKSRTHHELRFEDDNTGSTQQFEVWVTDS